MIIPRTLEHHQLDSILNIDRPRYIFTNTEGLEELEQYNIKMVTIKTYSDFHTSTLTLPFLNPATRAEAVHKCYLLEVER